MFIKTLMVVVLPAPLAPISAKALPSGTEKLKSLTASWCPNFLHSLLMRIIFDSLPAASRTAPSATRWLR